MVFKGKLDIDPRGMIFEAYRIDDVTTEECRMIFLDWALEAGRDTSPDMLNTLLSEYQGQYPDHPMTAVIKEGLNQGTAQGRRGGRKARIGSTS